MIILAHYFGTKPHPMAHEANANKLLAAVNLYLTDCHALGHYGWWVDPDTGTCISGAKGGSGDGGYRTIDSKTGAASSSHKVGQGVDIYDPDRKLAEFSVSKKGLELLDRHGLWIEDPRWTPVWIHVQCVSPKSGKRVYIPSTSAPLLLRCRIKSLSRLR